MLIKIRRYILDIKLLFSFSIKIQYGKSLLGSFWALLRPCMSIITFSVVMSKIADLPIKEFFSFIAINITIWSFISNIINFATINFSSKRGLLINVPFSLNKITAILVAKNFYIYLISMLLPLAAGFAFGSLKLGLELFAFVPYVLLLCYILFCIAFIISSVVPYFEDLTYLIEIALPIGMWFTPVVYPIEKIPGILADLQCVNPFYIMMSPFISIFYKHTLPCFSQNISILILAAILTGVYYFVRKKTSKTLIYHLSS